MSAKTNNRKQTMLILLIVAVILVVAVIFLIVNQQPASPTRMVNVPDVQTRLVAEDGSTHLFGARVVLEVDRSAGNVSNQQLHREVYAAISSLSYEDISGINGITNARNAIEDRLAYTFGDGELVSVLFGDFLSGMPLPQTGSGGGRNPVLDALLGTGDDL
ncbi:MAG: hypothetical protein FWE21_07880 [Defluviitaleaceae bacterium]|nr:hypothetical protein [Defluviitaleaceae bacterium]